MPTPSGAYSVVRSNVATTTAITVIQVAVPTTTVIDIVRAWGGQGSSTTSAATALGLVRKTAAATVTARTPDLLTDGMQASKCIGGTALTGITATVEGTDATNYLWHEGLNVVGNGALYLPVPEERISLGPSDIIGLKHSVAPAGNWIHGVTWLEYAY
jgi:hypothetical protein